MSAASRFTCRHLTGDGPNGREEKQGSQETGEKCIHVPQRGHASGRKKLFPPFSKSLVFFYPRRCFTIVVLRLLSLVTRKFGVCLLVSPAAVVRSGTPFSFPLCGLSISLRFQRALANTPTFSRAERQSERESQTGSERGSASAP